MTITRSDADTGMCRVYAIVPADAVDELPSSTAPARTVSHGRIAAVIGPVPDDRPLGTAEDLREHDRVIRVLVEAGLPVLPARFGAVLTDADAVARELLSANEQRFATALADTTGHVQFTLQVRYDQDSVVRAVVQDDPALARARRDADRSRSSLGAQVRLGEMVVSAISRRRDVDARAVHDALAPLAADVRTRTSDDPTAVVDLSFLVARDRVEQFERAAEDVARDHYDLMRLRLLGPLAPYDFVPVA